MRRLAEVLIINADPFNLPLVELHVVFHGKDG